MEALLSRPQQADANTAAAATNTADPEPGTPAAVLPRPLPVVEGSASAGDGSQASAGARVATAGSEDFLRRQRTLALTGCVCSCPCTCTSHNRSVYDRPTSALYTGATARKGCAGVRPLLCLLTSSSFSGGSTRHLDWLRRGVAGGRWRPYLRRPHDPRQRLRPPH